MDVSSHVFVDGHVRNRQTLNEHIADYGGRQFPFLNEPSFLSPLVI